MPPAGTTEPGEGTPPPDQPANPDLTPEPDTKPEAAPPAAPELQDPVVALAGSVQAAADELRRQQITLESLLKPLKAGDAKRGQEVAGTAAGTFAFAVDVPALLAKVQEVCAAEQVRRKDRLSAELKVMCGRAGLSMKVVAREPLVELRIAPIHVRLDRDRNLADVLYAQEKLEHCPASAEGILEARQRAVRTLEGDRAWNAAEFHGLLRRAWRYAMVDRDMERPDWVEIGDIHAHLERLLDYKKGYPRVRLAYDLWRLRRDRLLFCGGWRLLLGPATGDSARDKRRVLWIEDDAGGGQYHLTVKFLRQERLEEPAQSSGQNSGQNSGQSNTEGEHG